MTDSPADLGAIFRSRLETRDAGTLGFFDRSTESWSEKTHAQFLGQAASVANVLRDQGVVPGTPVVIATHSPHDTLLAFVGAILAAATPAILPIRPAFDGRAAIAARIDEALDQLGSHSVILQPEDAGSAAVAPRGRTVSVDFNNLAESSSVEPLRRRDASPISHIQLTSGSTGTGRAIAVTHAGVIANVEAIAKHGGITPYDVVVSWLPLYHDMGLIAHAMTSLILGVDAYFMSPFDFLSRPSRWVQTISDKRGTISFAPTFAYRVVSEKLSDLEVAQLDLSSWKFACCGSEPISGDVLRRFHQRLAPAGLKAEALLPCYGLAEATLAVTAPSALESWRSIHISTSSLAKLADVEVEAGPSATATEAVSLGRCLDGVEVHLIDDDGEVVRQELRCGEVVVGGASIAAGFIANGGELQPFENGIVRTGDLGFWHDGELFVVERIKNVVIRNGQNFSVRVIEESIAELTGLAVEDIAVVDRDITVGAGLTAVIGVDKGSDTDALLRPIVANVDGFEPLLEHVVFVKKGLIPRTTSGKKRHVALREMLTSGSLTSMAEHRLSTGRRPVDSAGADDSDIADTADISRLLEIVARHVRARVGDVPVLLTSRLQYDLDVDSLGLLELAMQIEDAFDVRVTRDSLASVTTVGDLTRVINAARSDADGNATGGVSALLDEIASRVPQNYLVVDAVRPGREAFVEGRWVTDFASCNYLGLEGRGEMHDAVRDMHSDWGLQRWPTRAVAAPRPLVDVEAALAELIGVPDVMVFPTISLLHFGVLPILGRNGGALILDSAAHTSMQEAAALAGAKGASISTFRHGDMADLERRLQETQGSARRVVVLDGVYSMSGSLLSLDDFKALAEKYDALLYIDDAHGFGVLGENPTEARPYGHRGNGIVRHLGSDYDRIIYVGGMAKAYSTTLAFVSCGTPEFKKLLQTASTMIFGHSVSMAALAQAKAGLEINEQEGDEIRDRVHALTTRLAAGAKQLGFTVAGEGSPIVNVILGDVESVITGANVLWDDGVLLTPAMFPAAPLDGGGLRFTVTPSNTEEQVTKVLKSLERVRQALDTESDSATVVELREIVSVDTFAIAG